MKLEEIIKAVILIGLSFTFLPILISAAENRNNRHNLFDPIFAYDDIDAHTVSAGPYSKQPIGSQYFQPQAIDSNDDGISPSFNVPPEKTRRDDGRSSSSPSKELSIDVKQRADQTVSTQPALVAPTFSEPNPILRPKVKPREPEQHWSALENYYEKLRQSLSSSPQGSVSGIENGRNQYQQLPIYQILQREADEPHSFADLNKNNQANNFPSFLLSNAKSEISTGLPQQQAFSLPISNQASNSGLRSEQDFGFSVHHHSAPGISRSKGIGSESILLNSESYGSEQSKSFGQGQQPLSSLSPVIKEDGKIKYLEWKKLPELLLIQQQQQRVKHQQETFGSWYDHQRSREILQEEAFCGPRNYVNFHLVPATSKEKDSKLQQQHSPMHLSRIQLEIGSSNLNAQQLDIPVALSAGEYPSHLGVYNNSVKDDDFLCSATWIHESFAITLASCVKSSKPNELYVRAGEWNYNKNITNPNERPMITRQVEQVYLFPKYKNDSVEHNLALLRFSKPIEYLNVPYICPACQMQSRTSIKTSSCWSPVRSTTKKEYFDADGEGETKEKKIVSMIELPVRLIANDDTECYRQTKVEFFNFQHPNYICSADYRLANWRSSLNQTEYFGSGIYCNEAGNLSLVSILHPIHHNSSSAFGYLDLSYYKPWMRNIISGRSF